jgi:hypothetical protein
LTLRRCLFAVCSAAVSLCALKRCLPKVHCIQLCATCCMWHVACNSCRC